MEGSTRGNVRLEDARGIETQSLQNNHQTSNDIRFRILGHKKERREQTQLNRNEDVALKWARRKNRLDHIRNEDIGKVAHMKPVETFLKNKLLKWFKIYRGASVTILPDCLRASADIRTRRGRHLGVGPAGYKHHEDNIILTGFIQTVENNIKELFFWRNKIFQEHFH